MHNSTQKIFFLFFAAVLIYVVVLFTIDSGLLQEAGRYTLLQPISTINADVSEQINNNHHGFISVSAHGLLGNWVNFTSTYWRTNIDSETLVLMTHSSYENWLNDADPAVMSVKYHTTPPLRWRQYRDLCLRSYSDNVHIPDTPGLNMTSFTSNGFSMTEFHTPYWLKVSNTRAMIHDTIMHLKGNTLEGACWRSSRFNPTHFMFGWSDIFSMMVDDSETYYDHVVLFQCHADITEPSNEFATNVWNIMWKYGISRKKVDENTKIHILPFRNDGIKQTLLCMDQLETTQRVPEYVNTDKHVLAIWRKYLSEIISDEIVTTTTTTDTLDGRFYIPKANIAGNETHYKEVKGCDIECTSNLKIHIFQRDSNDVNKRHFVNLGEVIRAIEMYVSQEVKVVFTSINVPWIEQVHIFNDFNILVGPHGSHNVNALFIAKNDSAIMEIVPACYHVDVGDGISKFLSKYMYSTGHLPSDNNIYNDVLQCQARKGDKEGDCHTAVSLKDQGGCNGFSFINGDVIVNIDILKKDLETLIRSVCKC